MEMKSNQKILFFMAVSLMILLLSSCGSEVREAPKIQYSPLSNLKPALEDYGSDSEHLVALGKMLFFDQRLSVDQQTSCASCHNPAQGFSGKGDATWRDVPGLVNVGYKTRFGWDGGTHSLAQQAEKHAQDALVMGANNAVIESRLALMPGYKKMFQVIFRSAKPKASEVWQAIAAFERSLVQTNTPFDRYMRGDSSALNQQQLAGLQLFSGQANCMQCHNGPLASDGNYYNTGVATQDLLRVKAEEQIAFRYRQRLAGLTASETANLRTDQGRWYVSRKPADKGAFLTPSLRELSHTAPYMHNGALQSLAEVVDFYNTGGNDPRGRTSLHAAGRSSIIKPLGMDAKDQAALVAFLQSLSGRQLQVKQPPLPRIQMVQPKVRPSKPPTLREQLTPKRYLIEPDSAQPSFRSPFGDGAGSLNAPNRVLSPY